MFAAEPCRLCRADSAFTFTAPLVTCAAPVKYYACPRCGLLQTEVPTWIEDAHSDALAAADTGAIDRNLVQARVTAMLAALLRIGPDDRCLDFGAGHGVFVRMMRDIGLDFRAYDRFAANMYARGFEGDARTAHRLATAFEVVEHFADPADGFAQLLGVHHDAVLVSTEVRRNEGPGWWYLMPGTGQHVAFYQERTLEHVAQQYDYTVVVASPYALFVRSGAFARPRVTAARLALRRPGALERAARVVPVAALRRLGGYQSRTQPDHDTVLQRERR